MNEQIIKMEHRGRQNLKEIISVCTGVIGDYEKSLLSSSNPTFHWFILAYHVVSTVVDLLERNEEATQAYRLVRMEMEF